MVQTQLLDFGNKRAGFAIHGGYVVHGNIKENTVLAKTYQIEIAKKCLRQNSAVILPTGLGKTIIAVLVIAEALPKRILFLAPTKPLVSQHYESCAKFLKIDEGQIIMLSGSISPPERAELWRKGKAIISTPQTVKNDLANGLYDLKETGLVIFDEMHKAVENYAYVEIAKKFHGLILGLTASPGSKKKKIKQILDNLKIKNIESRVMEDRDVKKHIKGIEVDWVKIPLSEKLKAAQSPLNSLFLEKVKKLNRLGILTYKKPSQLSKKDILLARAAIQKRFGKTPYAFPTYNNQAVLLQAYHCLELLETQGADSFLKYIDKFTEKKKLSKSERDFFNNENLQKAVRLASKSGESHPKLARLKEIVAMQMKEKKDSLILIFTQYRDTIDSIENTLKTIRSVRAHRFIGQFSQGKTKGMGQKEQSEIIQKFRKGEINTLIATSVAEEGIDIPDVSRVIFYESVPSEIRGIQRKGRTGRTSIGKVTILVAEGTRDEAYLYAEMQKENKMQRIISRMK